MLSGNINLSLMIGPLVPIPAPRAAIEALLAHCGLAFDEACLGFDRVDREVRTASAAQVRRPLEASVPAAQRYGARLDPLREALVGRGVFEPR